MDLGDMKVVRSSSLMSVVTRTSQTATSIPTTCLPDAKMYDMRVGQKVIRCNSFISRTARASLSKDADLPLSLK